MSVIICPGVHPPELTQEFLRNLSVAPANLLIFPTEKYPAFSAIDVLQFLKENQSLDVPVVFIGFSAGVVGAIGAAWGWQLLGGEVKALIALDGWGVTLAGNFPIHRLSHDHFTHWSSALLGAGEDSFYADPPVEHLELWRSPYTVQGWWVQSITGKSEHRRWITAGHFLNMLLEQYTAISVNN
ncbi:hypothetical protein [Crinalium epipsammum]|nr:hypothetical protein [Crinalium epipsammum]